MRGIGGEFDKLCLMASFTEDVSNAAVGFLWPHLSLCSHRFVSEVLDLILVITSSRHNSDSSSLAPADQPPRQHTDSNSTEVTYEKCRRDKQVGDAHRDVFIPDKGWWLIIST